MNCNFATYNEYLISLWGKFGRLAQAPASLYGQRGGNFFGSRTDSKKRRVSEQNFEQRAIFTSTIYPSLEVKPVTFGQTANANLYLLFIISCFTQFFVHRNCFELFLSAHFLFEKFSSWIWRDWVGQDVCVDVLCRCVFVERNITCVNWNWHARTENWVLV